MLTPNKSLAPDSEGATYYAATIRAMAPDVIALQVGSVGGYQSAPVSVSKDLGIWVSKLPRTAPSLSGSDKLYAPARVRRAFGNGPEIKVQVAGNALNRPWGAAFVVKSSELAEYIASQEPKPEEKPAS